MSKKLSKEQIEAVFAKFDGNGDGKLSKEEFQQLMAAKKWSISTNTVACAIFEEKKFEFDFLESRALWCEATFL